MSSSNEFSKLVHFIGASSGYQGVMLNVYPSSSQIGFHYRHNQQADTINLRCEYCNRQADRNSKASYCLGCGAPY